ncbi:MAG TPA: tripartite tricarboxylate transporter substrate binding protein [Eoetvoesiella sp.]
MLISNLKKLFLGVAVAITANTYAYGADKYPSQPIKIVVPVPAGGTSDFFARLIAHRLQQQLDVSVIVENRAGAGGSIGSAAVARAEPDGHTLLLASGGTHSINPNVYSKLPYDAIKDFTPIIRLAIVPNMLVVPKDLPVDSVKGLLDYIKSQPNPVSFGSSGVGTSIQLTGELFKQVTQTDMTHVPYKGSAPAMTDLIGGRLTLIFDNMPSALPQVQGGKIKALAVTSAKRSPAAPEIPTMEEEGFKGFEVTTWFGILAPAGTPERVVEMLNKNIAKILQNSTIQEQFIKAGAEVAGNDPKAFKTYMEEQLDKWHKIAEAANVTID